MTPLVNIKTFFLHLIFHTYTTFRRSRSQHLPGNHTGTKNGGRAALTDNQNLNIFLLCLIYEGFLLQNRVQYLKPSKGYLTFTGENAAFQ